MVPIVVADHLTKWYGARLAVDDVSFQVHQGEVMGLLGPNGSGKSSILRILTGYLNPSRGSARIAGFDVVTQGLEARSRVGYVPEDVPLYSHMRVHEFLGFMGRLRGQKGTQLAAAIDSVCERVSLQPVRDVLIAKLSRGYRQRVAIAQALIGDPKLLVLDEPTNGLDPRQIIELRGLVRGLASSCAVLVSSHILAEIERIANRAAILLNGRLLTVHPVNSGGTSQQLHIRVHARNAGNVETCIKTVPGVTDVAFETRVGSVATWRLRVTHEQVAQDLTAALSRAGYGVREIGPAASDLETVFLRLTAQPGEL